MLFFPGCFCGCSSWGMFWDRAELTSFAIPAQGIVGIINGTRISLVAENYSTIQPEVATFTLLSGRVSVGGVAQTSGVTANTFSETLVYRVVSDGGFTRDYTVTLFAPKTVSGLAAWYRADALSLADQTTITNWPDSSTSANHLSQTFGGTPPQFRTNQLNGKPVARFIRSGGNGDGIGRNTASGFSSPSLSLFIVLKHGAYYGTDQYVFVLDNAGGCTPNAVGFTQLLSNTSWNLDIVDPCDSFKVNSSPFTDTGSYHLLASIYNNPATNFRQWLDGSVTNSSSATINISSISYIALGNYGSGINSSFDGDIAEVLAYSTVLSEDNRVKISCYLTNKYALPTSENCP